MSLASATAKDPFIIFMHCGQSSVQGEKSDLCAQRRLFLTSKAAYLFGWSDYDASKWRDGHLSGIAVLAGRSIGPRRHEITTG